MAHGVGGVVPTVPSMPQPIRRAFTAPCSSTTSRIFTTLSVGSGVDDRKPHILVLDGHTSHVKFEAIRSAISLNIELFQLSSQPSHMNQPLDVAAFGSFKRATISVLGTFGDDTTTACPSNTT